MGIVPWHNFLGCPSRADAIDVIKRYLSPTEVNKAFVLSA